MNWLAMCSIWAVFSTPLIGAGGWVHRLDMTSRSVHAKHGGWRFDPLQVLGPSTYQLPYLGHIYSM